jgi:hypothetical protein
MAGFAGLDIPDRARFTVVNAADYFALRPITQPASKLYFRFHALTVWRSHAALLRLRLLSF